MSNVTYRFSVEDINLMKFISQLNELAVRSKDTGSGYFWAYSSLRDVDIKHKFGSCINPASQVFLYDDIHPIEGPVGMTLYPLVRQVLITQERKEIISYYNNIFVQEDGVSPSCLVAYPNMDNTNDCIYIEDGEWFF